MEKTAKSFGKPIWNREDMLHDNVLCFGLVFDGKMFKINMVRPFCGDTVVDHKCLNQLDLACSM